MGIYTIVGIVRLLGIGVVVFQSFCGVGLEIVLGTFGDYVL